MDFLLEEVVGPLLLDDVVPLAEELEADCPERYVHAITPRTRRSVGTRAPVYAVIGATASSTDVPVGWGAGAGTSVPGRSAMSTSRSASSRVTRVAGPTVSWGAAYPGTGEP